MFHHSNEKVTNTQNKPPFLIAASTSKSQNLAIFSHLYEKKQIQFTRTNLEALATMGSVCYDI